MVCVIGQKELSACVDNRAELLIHYSQWFIFNKVCRLVWQLDSSIYNPGCH